MRAHLSRVALTIVMSVSSPLAMTSAQERAAEPEQAEEQIRQARITAQKATIHLRRNQLARTRRLFEANAVLERQLRQAERDLAKATLQLAIIENDAVTIVDQLELIIAASAAELKRLTILNDKNLKIHQKIL